ncbi:MAG TPA: hypothetical protein VD833_25315, partial [Vicinamibacterales bacterium]|nr:hypothetical protein [Vicinamibacterales bacterium]
SLGLRASPVPQAQQSPRLTIRTMNRIAHLPGCVSARRRLLTAIGWTPSVLENDTLRRPQRQNPETRRKKV